MQGDSHRRVKVSGLFFYFEVVAKRRRSKKNSDELNSENEFLKLKMMAEFGGNFMGSDNLPPEIENQFLKQVMQFHKQQHGSENVSVHEYIGSPGYQPTTALDDKTLKKELGRLRRIMTKQRVVLEVLAPTPDREIYRFITEELFKHQMENIKVKGWVNHFIYEEFHPNTEYDVKQTVHQLLFSLYTKGAGFFQELFSENMKDHLGLSTDAQELQERVEEFHSRYNDVALVTYEFIECTIEEDTAYVQCDVTYKTQKEKGRRSKREVTTVEVYLNRKAGTPLLWEINRVEATYV